MDVRGIYLGVWFQRTTLHLRELYEFLRDGSQSADLPKTTGRKLRTRLKIAKTEFHSEESHYSVSFSTTNGISGSISDEGVILLSTSVVPVKKAIRLLSAFYQSSLSPALAHLFSRGAPIPKTLGVMESIYPLVIITTGGSTTAEVSKLLKVLDDELIASTHSPHLDLHLASRVQIFAVKHPRLSMADIEEVLRTIIFFRDAEEQLRRYLTSHRSIWDWVTDIRTSREIQYRKFPMIRSILLEQERDLSFIRARIEQMKDSLQSREADLSSAMKTMLTRLGLNRFAHLASDLDYVEQLITMTNEYVGGTLKLLGTLYDENTQRELAALKLITLFGALAGFFGMNIAFPWNEEWPDQLIFSLGVVGILVLGMLVFQWGLKLFVYNRRFTVSMVKGQAKHDGSH